VTPLLTLHNMAGVLPGRKSVKTVAAGKLRRHSLACLSLLRKGIVTAHICCGIVLFYCHRFICSDQTKMIAQYVHISTPDLMEWQRFLYLCVSEIIYDNVTDEATTFHS
jgi:hypothetical protein